MTPKDDIEMRKAALLKAARSAVRLKYSLMADEELNETLPRVERRFNAMVANGVVPTLSDLLADERLLT